MRFKLFLEDGYDGPSGIAWDLLYPSKAGDYMDAVNSPQEHHFLQWKWNRGLDRRIGRRPLYNIDNQEFQQRRYTTIESPSSPDVSDGFWEHKPDDENRGYLKPIQNVEMIRMGYGSNSTDVKEIEGYNFCCRPFGETSPWTDAEDSEVILDKIFNDKDTHKHVWPDLDLQYMDSRWDKQYETVLHGGIADPVGSGTNTSIGIKSDLEADDSDRARRKRQPSENDPSKKFGFDGGAGKEWSKWIHKNRPNKKKTLNIPLRDPEVYD
jgi:hypothetical protein